MKDLVLKVVEKNLGHRTFVDTAFDAAVTFIVQRPSSTTLGWPDPDIDNYQKAIFDQLNLVLFDDDRCIVGVNAEKRWTKTNEKPGIIIELTSLGRFKVPHAKTKTRERSARGTGTVPRVSKQRRGQ
jgi:Holliday junction resolvase RusA-like endonuclease